MQHEATKRGLNVIVDSAGTVDYHEGEEPDERTVATCKKHGVPINSLARAVKPNDFHTFDWILASDQQNLANLQRMTPKGSTAKVALFGSFDDNQVIKDPYYGGSDGFERTYEQCVRYSDAFFRSVFPSSSL